eukprot:CAMPEP_0118645710 /NCGR_PEP_ID=MMETSP0785-20121206/7651_1 /TAXON_ID=91992 /ORGANISM="Bolidomonas pacifica, Strain CCMP 1866" /LENGTH=70 /DNA_ID=CAMNT_0006537621 /DNA_START=205 /DNA_END=414 /DNA_ORIENTATION=+
MLPSSSSITPSSITVSTTSLSSVFNGVLGGAFKGAIRFMSSTLKKRKTKINKHKLKKRRKKLRNKGKQVT